MNDVKQEWVRALREGTYSSGKTGGQYCALGMLADVETPVRRRKRLRLPFVIISRRRLEELENA